jgi:hypothetical protein
MALLVDRMLLQSNTSMHAPPRSHTFPASPAPQRARPRAILCRSVRVVTLPLALLAAACDSQAAPDRAAQDASSPTPARSALEVVASEEAEPFHIATDARFVYWTTRQGIRAASLAGGSAFTLHASSTLRAIAAAGDALFYADYAARNIGRIRDGDPDSREVFVQDANPSALAIAGGHLYWTQASEDNVIQSGAREGSIARVALSGGDPEVLASALEHPLNLAVTDEAVFFGVGSGGGVYRLLLDGTGVERVADAFAAILAAGGDGVYLSAHDRLPAALVKLPNRGAPVTLLDGLRSHVALAVDASGVYLLSENGRVSRTAHDGGALETLATDLSRGRLGALALAADAIYLTAPVAGQVLRLDKRGAPPLPANAEACPEPRGSAEVLAATPRAERDIELLSIRLDGEIVATQATYERLVADFAALRSALAGVSVGYRAPHDGKTLFLQLSESAAMSMRSREYHAWDCLNDHYGLEDLRVEYSTLTDTWYGLLTLEGIYDMPSVAGVYAQLPGVHSAQPDGAAGDGPTTCAARSGERYEYVVDLRAGDCPAGCTETTAHRFISESAGRVEMLDVWQSAPNAGRRTDAPAWYAICDDF